MAQPSEYANEETVTGGPVRIGWLKAMFGANVVISAPIGLASIVVPEITRTQLGIPATNPVTFGIANGAVPLAFGIAGLLGLRSPLRLAPILGLQVIYKTAFLVGVVLPMVVAGSVPGYAVPIIGIFVFFIVGNLIALPIPYVLSPASDR